MSFDPQCYELATYFLADVEGTKERHVRALAEAIQLMIEQWLDSDEAPHPDDEP